MAWTRRGATRAAIEMEKMACLRQAQPTTTNHAVLGPGVALYETMQDPDELILWIAMILLGLFGSGSGAGYGSGATLLGVAEILGGRSWPSIRP